MVIEDYELTGTIVVNQYLWERLSTELGWTTIAVKNPDGTTANVRPIFPAQEQPEAASQSKPYLVYTYSISTAREPGINREQVTYGIYATKEQDVRKAVNFLSNIFQHWDDSADDVNAWLAYKNGIPELNMYEFKTVSLVDAIGPQPTTSEGGQHDGAVVIRIEYTRINGGGPINDPYVTSYRDILGK